MSKLIDLLPLALALLLFWKAAPVHPLSSFHNSYMSIAPCRSVRGFMAMFVILHHLSQQTECGYLMQMFRLFGNLPVSVFFFLSGYGLMKKHLQSEKFCREILRRKLPLLLLPLLIALLICYILKQVTFSMQISPMFMMQQLINGDPILVIYWYMLLIPVLYLAFSLSSRFFPKQRSAPVFCMLLFTLIVILLGNHISLGQWWYNTCHLFTVGLIWAAFEDEISAFVKKYYWLCLIFSGALFLFVWQYFDLLFALWPTQEMRLIISLVRNLAFTLSFIFVTMKLRFSNPILDTLGKVSLELYLLHPVFLLLFRNEVICIADDVLFCLAVISGSIIFSLLLSRPYTALCRKYTELVK